MANYYKEFVGLFEVEFRTVPEYIAISSRNTTKKSVAK
jgi:hypothetical protein